ncbi:MAG: hypothetical protein U0L88_04805 [Acutalibacteraceae bacterium]|nr:hypothetical protein [Acutalibacteraceae bacterium]
MGIRHIILVYFSPVSPITERQFFGRICFLVERTRNKSLLLSTALLQTVAAFQKSTTLKVKIFVFVKADDADGLTPIKEDNIEKRNKSSL